MADRHLVGRHRRPARGADGADAVTDRDRRRGYRDRVRERRRRRPVDGDLAGLLVLDLHRGARDGRDGTRRRRRRGACGGLVARCRSAVGARCVVGGGRRAGAGHEGHGPEGQKRATPASATGRCPPRRSARRRRMGWNMVGTPGSGAEVRPEGERRSWSWCVTCGLTRSAMRRWVRGVPLGPPGRPRSQRRWRWR